MLVYSTPPLARDVEVTGFITVDLYAATSAADTDFTAMIVDVDPTGYARYLGDGIIRARYRNSTEKAEPIEPGKIYNTRSICGRRAMSSRPGIASGSTSPAAISRGSTGI